MKKSTIFSLFLMLLIPAILSANTPDSSVGTFNYISIASSLIILIVGVIIGHNLHIKRQEEQINYRKFSESIHSINNHLEDLLLSIEKISNMKDLNRENFKKFQEDLRQARSIANRGILVDATVIEQVKNAIANIEKVEEGKATILNHIEALSDKEINEYQTELIMNNMVKIDAYKEALVTLRSKFRELLRK